MRLAKIENAALKNDIFKVRQINQTQIENHAKAISLMEAQHLKALKMIGDEFTKSINENARLQNENYLLKAREEVMVSLELEEANNKVKEVHEVEIDECIMDIKCTGNCNHVAEQDLRDLKNLRKIKHQGGQRNSPLENSDVRVEVLHRCPQCNSKFQNKTGLQQHVKDSHSNAPSCPFCHIGFVNHLYLRNHIDQNHQEKTLKIVQKEISRKKGICAFFQQPQGCKKGLNCDYSHEKIGHEYMIKIRKFCRNGPSCSWKPGCKFVHPEDGEAMPAREQKEKELGFVLPDVTQPPPGYSLASSTDFPVLQRISVIKQNILM